MQITCPRRELPVTMVDRQPCWLTLSYSKSMEMMYYLSKRLAFTLSNVVTHENRPFELNEFSFHRTCLGKPRQSGEFKK